MKKPFLLSGARSSLSAEAITPFLMFVPVSDFGERYAAVVPASKWFLLGVDAEMVFQVSFSCEISATIRTDEAARLRRRAVVEIERPSTTEC